MHKPFCVPLLFLSVAAAAFGLCLLINNQTPVLPNGSALPPDIQSRQYAVTGITYSAAHNGYSLSLAVPESSGDLMLTMTDMENCLILQNGIKVYAHTDADAYARVQTLWLHEKDLPAGSRISLVFSSERWGGDIREFFTRRVLMPAKLLIGGVAVSQRAMAIGFGIAMFSMGLHALLIGSTFVLFLKKRSEKYLMVLSAVAAVSLAATFFSTNIPLLSIRQSAYAQLRPLISIAPLMLNASICFYLYQDCVPQRLRRLLTARSMLILTFVLILGRMFSNFSIYNVTRVALLFPILATLSTAYAKKKPAALVMAASYAVAEAIVLHIYYINTLGLSHAGLPIIYLQLNQISYLSILLCGLFVINHRFAEKFEEAEQLSVALSKMNAELDALVEQRTRQLQSEQVQRHTMMMNVFHDLRSPLFILKGNLDMIRPAPQEQCYYDAIRGKLGFLQRLTEDMFMIAKMEKNLVLYEEEPLLVGALLAGLVRASAPEAAASQIRLLLTAEGDCTIWADPARLQQMFQNILDNAFTYTPKGGEITVVMERTDQIVTVRVRNTGTGIAPEKLPLVFDRYFRGSRAENPRSSGLGLSIAKEIAEHHQGSIGVLSRPGITEFYVSLPVWRGNMPV